MRKEMIRLSNANRINCRETRKRAAGLGMMYIFGELIDLLSVIDYKALSVG